MAKKDGTRFGLTNSLHIDAMEEHTLKRMICEVLDARVDLIAERVVLRLAKDPPPFLGRR